MLYQVLDEGYRYAKQCKSSSSIGQLPSSLQETSASSINTTNRSTIMQMLHHPFTL